MPKRRGRMVAFGGFVMLVATVVTPVSANDTQQSPGAFIEALAREAVNSLTSEDADRGKRIKRFRIMFNENFAVRSIGKFVLGRYWRRAKEDERKEYLELFEDLMVVSYVDRFAKYAGESLAVKKTRNENKNMMTVFSEIDRSGDAGVIHVDWRVGTDGTVYKVLDVVVEGVSLSNTLRSDFSSIVRRNGGKVSGLIKELRLKTAALNSEQQGDSGDSGH